MKTHRYNHLKFNNSIDVKAESLGQEIINKVDKGSSLDTLTNDDIELELKIDALTEK